MTHEKRRIETDLVDAIEITEDQDDAFGPYRWYEIISFKGWDDQDFDERQVKFNKQADEILKLLGCNLDSGEVSEGPVSCSVSAWVELDPCPGPDLDAQ